MYTVADAEGAGSGVARLPERRRAGPRVALTARIEIETRGAGPPIPGSTLDIGLGGLCAQIEQPIELPEVTGVRIMHGRQDLTLIARGCWVRPAQFGVGQLLGLQFAAVEPALGAKLWQVLTHRALELAHFLVSSSDLAPIDVDIAMDLAFGTRRRQFGAHQYVYKEGTALDAESSLYILAHGRVSLEATTTGGAQIQLDCLDVGGVFGGAPLLVGVPHLDSALSLTAIQVVEIDAFSLRGFAIEKPLVARTLERAAIRRYLRHISTLLGASSARDELATAAERNVLEPLARSQL